MWRRLMRWRRTPGRSPIRRLRVSVGSLAGRFARASDLSHYWLDAHVPLVMLGGDGYGRPSCRFQVGRAPGGQHQLVKRWVTYEGAESGPRGAARLQIDIASVGEAELAHRLERELVLLGANRFRAGTVTELRSSEDPLYRGIAQIPWQHTDVRFDDGSTLPMLWHSLLDDRWLAVFEHSGCVVQLTGLAEEPGAVGLRRVTPDLHQLHAPTTR